MVHFPSKHADVPISIVTTDYSVVRRRMVASCLERSNDEWSVDVVIVVAVVPGESSSVHPWR